MVSVPNITAVDSTEQASDAGAKQLPMMRAPSPAGGGRPPTPSSVAASTSTLKASNNAGGGEGGPVGTLDGSSAFTEPNGREMPPSPVSSPGATTPEAAVPKKPMRECDYDLNPTPLYLSIQKKQWDDAITISSSNPEQAATWVSRKERDGKLRWKLLPLHAAIIFKAPEKTIESLLCAYPPGAQCKDDQGMLPIHLAFRNGSTEGVVNLLLVAYPQSIDVKDRKGRIPLTLAQASASPNRDAFLRALERGPSYYAVAAAATERASVQADLRAEYDAKIVQLTAQHDREKESIKQAKDAELIDHQERIGALEAELAKTQETSQVLVDHVNSLEAQLSSRSDTERFLATKIANLDAQCKETSATKESVESELRASNRALEEENSQLQSRVSELEQAVGEYKTKADSSVQVAHKVKSISNSEKNKMEKRIKHLETELATSKADGDMLEKQLEKKIESEATLAGQVSELATKLAESASTTSQSTASYVKKAVTMEKERDALQIRVTDLTKRLASVAVALDAMAAEQERIVTAASRHEQTMQIAAEAQKQIVDDTARQERLMADAAREREQIVTILTRQAEDVERSVREREKILDGVRRQEEGMRKATEERDRIVESVERQKINMRGLVENELKDIVKEEDEDSDDEGSHSDNEEEAELGDDALDVLHDVLASEAEVASPTAADAPEADEVAEVEKDEIEVMTPRASTAIEEATTATSMEEVEATGSTEEAAPVKAEEDQPPPQDTPAAQEMTAATVSPTASSSPIASPRAAAEDDDAESYLYDDVLTVATEDRSTVAKTDPEMLKASEARAAQAIAAAMAAGGGGGESSGGGPSLTSLLENDRE